MRSLTAAFAVSVCCWSAHPAGAQSVSTLWSENCQLCHGNRGQGGGAGAVSLLTPQWRSPDLDSQFFDTIKNGIPEKAMPGFGETLSDAQTWGLVVHIRELQERARREKEGGPQQTEGVFTSTHHKYRIRTVIPGGLDVPWAVDFMPDGAMLVTERPGGLRVFKDGKLSDPVQGTPKVRNSGQGGLMEVTLHPEFSKNGWVYLAYSDSRKDSGRDLGMTRIVRGKINDNRWTDEQTLFQAKPEHYSQGEIHFGCRIVFTEPDATGKRAMFFAIGERGMMELAQDLKRPNGKVHRLYDDGSVPTDNPFLDTKDAYPSIWSYGHRNPQGLVFDLSGALWDTEHGPRGGDELNLIEKGRNYGWPTVSFGINYNGAPFRTPWGDPAIAMPVYRWLPSIGVCGLDLARGPAFEKWKGDLIAGGLSGTNVDRIRIKDGRVTEREELVFGMGRVRDVSTAPDGTIYVVLNDPDKVVRLVPEN